MDKRLLVCMVTAALVLLAVLAGCTSQPSTTAPVTTAIQTPPPATTAPAAPATPAAVVTTAAVKVTTQQTKAVKVILHTTGNVTPKSYQTFDFSKMGDEFSKVGVDYQIAVKADKPILGYAVMNSQAAQLQSSELTPTYLPGSTKINWGLITPYMIMEKVTDSQKTFTIDTEAPYVYVLDGRYLATGNATIDAIPLNYEITITKIYYPVPTPQPNLKY